MWSRAHSHRVALAQEAQLLSGHSDRHGNFWTRRKDKRERLQGPSTCARQQTPQGAGGSKCRAARRDLRGRGRCSGGCGPSQSRRRACSAGASGGPNVVGGKAQTARLALRMMKVKMLTLRWHFERTMVAEARRGVRGRFLFTRFARNTRTTYTCQAGFTAAGQPSGAESLSVVRGGNRIVPSCEIVTGQDVVCR